MQYISFYKSRLPFKPKSNVVIYFDAMGVGLKKYYQLLHEEYDLLVEEFRRGGLEFCFLPKIAKDMDLRVIYRYFNPQVDENTPMPYFDLYRDRDLLEYMVEGYDERRLEPGLIQYMGEGFDREDTYTFSYTPMGDAPYPMLREYVRQHGVREPFFGRRERESLFGRFFQRNREAAPARASESCCMECSIPAPAEEDIDVEMVMSEVQMLVERLRQSGVGEIALQRLFKPTQELSRIHVRYGRIFLPDYNNKESRCLPCRRRFICSTCAIRKASSSPICPTTARNC